MASNNDHTNTSGSLNRAYEMVKHVMIDIGNEVQDQNTTGWSIYRVPSNLWKLNKDAYTPQLVSIGPLHYHRKELKPMQNRKLQYLNFFLDRADNKAIDSFKEFLKGKEELIRHCYYTEKLCDIRKEEKLCDISKEEKLCDICKDEFVEMMMLDSIFIMELFLRIQKEKFEEINGEKHTYSYDIIVKQSWLNKSIQRDLLLLENQIPWFVLKELYDKVVPAADKNSPTFIELTHDYFKPYHPKEDDDPCSNCKSLKDNNTNKNYEPQHFTDLIRSFYICEDLKKVNKGLSLNTATKLWGVNKEQCLNTATKLEEVNKGLSLKTATKLRESGVSFEKVKNKPLLDIKFKRVPILHWFLCLGCIPNFTYFKARLQIPELKVDDTTECVLRNLIAFEQCHYPDQPYICNYVSFIDSLIHTKDDVELLVEKEVIKHELGSHKEVATLVNGLCKHVVTNKTCYTKLIDSLDTHYQRQWYRTMAALRLVYFRDTWRASSTLVGILVLIFTIFNFCRVVRLVLDLDERRRP